MCPLHADNTFACVPVIPHQQIRVHSSRIKEQWMTEKCGSAHQTTEVQSTEVFG